MFHRAPSSLDERVRKLDVFQSNDPREQSFANQLIHVGIEILAATVYQQLPCGCGTDGLAGCFS